MSKLFKTNLLTEYAAAKRLESKPIFQALRSRTVTSETAVPSNVPIKHINAVNDSSAGYSFSVNDCVLT